jgi:exopolyphosphatase/guanosine-5'-triphosphate,3'-diphosphate pyrophosphatase
MQGDGERQRAGGWGDQQPDATPGRCVAVVDCGSNSTRLLVAQVADGRVVRAQRRTVLTRLGGQVERTGRLTGAAIARVTGVLEDYAGRWRAAGCDRVAICATSAVRDAGNAEAFVHAVERATGVTPLVLSGADEAELTFTGAVAGMDHRQVVCDIGGGSTELIVGASAPRHRASLQLGSVRLRERHLHHDPPTRDEYAALVADIDAALDDQPDVYRAGGPMPLVAVGGTATTLAAVAVGAGPDDLDQIDGAVMPLADLQQLVEDLAWLPARHRLEHPAIVSGREDVVVAGALLLVGIAGRYGFGAVQVRVADLLDGIALRLAAGGWPPARTGLRP